MTEFRSGLHPDLHYQYDKAIEAVVDFERNIASTDLSAFDELKAHFAVVDYFIRSGEGEGIGGI